MGKYVSLKLATKATLSVLDKFEKKKAVNELKEQEKD